MTKNKSNILIRFRNYFITGIVVLIPIGITLYLTLFLVSVSSNLLPKELNPNYYLPYSIPGVEILISIIIITFIGWLSLSFIGKRLLGLINSILKKIPTHTTEHTTARKIYRSIPPMQVAIANYRPHTRSQSK